MTGGFKTFFYILCAFSVLVFAPTVSAQDIDVPSPYKGKWHFSPQEMDTIYAREYVGEKLLKNRLRREGGKIVGAVGGASLEVPEAFVLRILDDLRQMIEAGATRLIFRLDAFHAHPFMDEALYYERYGRESKSLLEDAKILVNDPDVGMLYHNSEHLLVEADDAASVRIYAKRNVWSFGLGKEIVILPLPDGKVKAASAPAGTTGFRRFPAFAAHKDGEFILRANGTEIRLDISLDDTEYY